MSHFTVLVIGEDAEEQLEPFNEQNEDFFEFTDEEDEYKKEYDNDKIEVAKLDDGTYVSIYDDKAKEKKGKMTPINKVYETFETFMKDYHGMTRNKKTKRYGSNRNPKSKWDWYDLGGRWTGFFKLKNRFNKGNRVSEAALKTLAIQYNTTLEQVKERLALIQNNDEKGLHGLMKTNPISGGYYLEKSLRELATIQYENAKVGKAGLGTNPPEAGYVDSARIKDIDFEGMMRDAGIEAHERYEKLEGLMGGTIPKLTLEWDKLNAEEDKKPKSERDYEAMRNKYHSQPAKLALEQAKNRVGISEKDRSLLTWLDIQEYQCTKEEYVRRAENKALSTFAVLKDGEWYEKGKMGWWAVVYNEMDQDKWNEQFLKLIRDLDPETVISVYDCHI